MAQNQPTMPATAGDDPPSPEAEAERLIADFLRERGATDFEAWEREEGRRPVLPRFGFVHPGPPPLFFFTVDRLRLVLGEVRLGSVAAALVRRGVIEPGDDGRGRARHHVPSQGREIELYAITPDFLRCAGLAPPEPEPLVDLPPGNLVRIAAEEIAEALKGWGRAYLAPWRADAGAAFTGHKIGFLDRGPPARFFLTRNGLDFVLRETRLARVAGPLVAHDVLVGNAHGGVLTDWLVPFAERVIPLAELTPGFVRRAGLAP